MSRRTAVGPCLTLTLALAVIAAFGLSACTGGTGSAKDATTPDCRVELWSVPWDTYPGVELDEDSIPKAPLVQRHRVKGCKFAAKVRDYLDHAMLLPPSATPPGGDLRLLVRVRTESGSWLLGFPQTCSFVRLDRTRLYRHDTELFALLTKRLSVDERDRIERFGACRPPL